MENRNIGRPRPVVEDYLRAATYLAFMGWSVMFTFFPPEAFVSALDVTTRSLWMAAVFVGGSLALSGALTRIDIKLELPGLFLLLVGPILYFASQFYYVTFPTEDIDVKSRLALVIYAIIPALQILPRLYALYRESRRLKALHSSPLNQVSLTENEKKQAGAGITGPSVLKDRRGSL